MSELLQDLISSAKARGWATGKCSLERLTTESYQLEMLSIPIRKGEKSLTTLRPVSIESAHPNSLSVKYGMGSQPLHTDGAHLYHPPDIVILWSAVENSTSTYVYGMRNVAIREAFSHGLFLVHNGRESFYSPSYTYENGLRYDPGCMYPCDHRARQAAKQFEDMFDSAEKFDWDEPGKLLVIDNKHALHARDEVSAGDEERILHRLSFRQGKRS